MNWWANQLKGQSDPFMVSVIMYLHILEDSLPFRNVGSQQDISSTRRYLGVTAALAYRLSS